MSSILVREVENHDVEGVTSIYNNYVQNSLSTFEEEPISFEEMKQRVSAVKDHALPWLVAVHRNDVVGYAYALPWKARSAYRFCAEVTVYVDNRRRSTGVGSELYQTLFRRLLDSSDIRVVVACLSLPNDVSVALHEKFGMKKVAHFSEVGFKFGKWVDVGYWQLHLEHYRS